MLYRFIAKAYDKSVGFVVKKFQSGVSRTTNFKENDDSDDCINKAINRSAVVSMDPPGLDLSSHLKAQEKEEVMPNLMVMDDEIKYVESIENNYTHGKL